MTRARYTLDEAATAAMLRNAALEKMRFQARREAQHEAVRRSHRITALAGGGERECARRREQMAKGMR